MSPVPNDDLIASAPSASEASEAPPAHPDDGLGLTEKELVEAGITRSEAPKVRRYIPCTGAQIGKFLRAVEMGLKGAHDMLESEIDAFLKEKVA